MNIAEVTNSRMGRAINMNSSHIGRLRSGARPLPKKHEYLKSMCEYLAKQIKKEYQINSLQKLTGISTVTLESCENMAVYLEEWLLMQDTQAGPERFISGFSRVMYNPEEVTTNEEIDYSSHRYAEYLYGNEGKRKAVEQFFLMILKEDTPQELLLFSDENVAWLFEDAAFSKRWSELFMRVLMKGNHVRIIHTISRDMNDLFEALTKWIPIYMNGAVKPYYYPRLRDGVFQHTLFIAPKTAAVVSTSIMQNTEGMFNLFVTDQAALNALCMEYEQYFSLCKPLIHILSEKDSEGLFKTVDGLFSADGDAIYYSVMPPLFSIPENMLKDLPEQITSKIHQRSIEVFKSHIKKHSLSVVVLDPSCIKQEATSDLLFYTREQYRSIIEHLKALAEKYKNLKIFFQKEISPSTLIYAKEDVGVLIAKADFSSTAFALNERNMITAIWEYLQNKK